MSDVLNRHPAVKEALVYGTEDATCGQVPTARLVLKGPAAPDLETALRQHCRAHLSSYKVPVRFEFVSALPRTPSGKLLRRPADPVSGKVMGLS